MTSQNAAKNHTDVKTETDCKHYVRVQAQAAFSKLSSNSCLELEDLVAMGTQTMEVAKSTFKSDGGAKFNTYLTVLLQRDFFKVVRDSYSNKWYRKERVLDNGEVVNEKIQVKCLSLDDVVSTTMEKERFFFEPEAKNDDPDYEILAGQVARLLDDDCKEVYKQMIDPDEELLKIAAGRVQNPNGDKRNYKCVVASEMMAKYMGMSKEELEIKKKKVKSQVKAILKDC